MSAGAGGAAGERRGTWPPLIAGVAWLVGLQLAAYTAMRLAFYAAFRAGAGDVSPGEVTRAFWLGLRFDLRVALLVALPLLVLGAFGPLRPSRRWAALAWRAWILCCGLLITLIYLFDLGHYGYLHERLNAMVLDELRSPREAAGMLWETYPVLGGALALGLSVLGWAGLARLVVRKAGARRVLSLRSRLWTSAACALAVAVGIYGNLSWYPLRWSQAFQGTNPFIVAFASNPVLYFSASFSHRSRRPDGEAVARHYDRLADLLEVERRDADALAFARWFEPAQPPAFTPNLIVVHLESWAAFQTGAMGNPLPSSPCFDALARDSLLFTSFFVPTGPTARSVFSMLTGIPDVPANNPESSASRDPASVRQPVLVNALRGYSKHYFLGGSANWANIRALLAGNIQDLQIHEEGSYRGERVDVWGISDLDLFESAVETLDREAGPFFAFIQTSGNHAPYTIPDRTEGFEPAGVDEETLRRAGFKSLAAYDGFRFLDHALGRFLELARERPWYRDTVFAFYGDHGVPAVNGGPFEHLGLVRQHVPLLIHAPRLLPAGRRIDDPASSVDILPTCLALMGVPRVNSSLGRDALAERPAERRFAFLANGLVEGGWFWREERDGRTGLHRYASEAPLEDWAARERERAEELATTYRALLDWALWTQHDAGRRLELEQAPRPL